MTGQRQGSVLPVVASGLWMVLSFAAPVSAQQRPIDTQRSTMTVRVFKSGLFSAFADNHVIKAPVSDGVVEESSTSRVALVVDVSQMRVWDPGLSQTQRDDVQRRMLGPQVLDASRFTQIRFESTAVEQRGTDRWVVHGTLGLHGQTRPITVIVSRERGHYKGETTLLQSDFGITPISIAGGTVRVKDQLAIEFDIVTVGDKDS